MSNDMNNMKSTRQSVRQAAKTSVIEAVNKYYADAKVTDTDSRGPKIISEDNWSGTVKVCPSGDLDAAVKHVCRTLRVDVPPNAREMAEKGLDAVADYVWNSDSDGGDDKTAGS